MPFWKGRIDEVERIFTHPRFSIDHINNALGFPKLVAIDHETAPVWKGRKEESRKGAILEGTDDEGERVITLPKTSIDHITTLLGYQDFLRSITKRSILEATVDEGERGITHPKTSIDHITTLLGDQDLL